MPEHQRPVVGTVESSEGRADLDRLDVIAEWLDRRYLDPLMNLFLPGAGNTVSSLVGLYAVFVAVRLRVHPIVIARMLINLALDSIIGAIPLLGWIFDFFYRAHVKNLEILKQRGEAGNATSGDWFIVLLAAALFVVALSLPLIILGVTAYFILEAI